MATIKKKKVVPKKRKTRAKTDNRNILKLMDAVKPAALALTNRPISNFRAAINPVNGYGEIEIADATGAITKIFAATNPALFGAILIMLNNPSKSITNGGYVYITG